MEISINLTIVVQMLHFIAAYIFITQFFLRPGYRAVTSDMNRTSQLKNNIIARQELIAHKQTYKRTRWTLFQDYFLKQKPQFVDQVKPKYQFNVSLSIPSVNEKELTVVSEKIAQSVLKKVLNDY